MILDCFPYFNERELLELRINFLKDHVDRFIICEGDRTFSGNKKEFTLRKTIEELGLPKEKIIVIQVNLPSNNDQIELTKCDLKLSANDEIKAKNWARERIQRDAWIFLIDKFKEDTYFIVSDCDEIINPKFIGYCKQGLTDKNSIVKVPLVQLEGRADMRVFNKDGTPYFWDSKMFFCMKHHLQKLKPNEIRNNIDPNPGNFNLVWVNDCGERVEDMGWHFSWMGDSHQKKIKSSSFSHCDDRIEGSIFDNLNSTAAHKFFDNWIPEDDGINPWGNSKTILKKYPKELLPQQIFELDRVNKFLIGDLKMKKVVDCFPFFNEKELLELRVNLLKDYVDKFIICESNQTHSGKPKEFVANRLIKELGLPADMIEVIEMNIPSEENINVKQIDEINSKDSNSTKEVKAWSRERIQRDAVLCILDKFEDDTVFIMSDCDEIINPDAINYFTNFCRDKKQYIIKVPLVLLEGRADMRVYSGEEPVKWNQSLFICTKVQLKSSPPTNIRSNIENKFEIVWLTQDGKTIEDIGWHFTWMGDENRRKTKAESFIHYANINAVNTLSSESMYQINNTINKYSLKKYPISSLPKKLFELERVKNFLLGESNFTKLL